MRMQSKRPTTEESTDRAVSPVIGVILMVAITVILAAVIAAFVLDIGPGDTSVNAGVSVSGEDVEVTDGGNADSIAIVDTSGNVVSHDDANSGNVMSGACSDEDYNIFAVQGDVSDTDPVDDAEASTQIASCS